MGGVYMMDDVVMRGSREGMLEVQVVYRRYASANIWDAGSEVNGEIRLFWVMEDMIGVWPRGVMYD